MNGATRTITLIGVLAVLVIPMACTGPDEPVITLPSVTSPPSTPSPTAGATATTTPRQKVIDAYLGMQRAFAKASEVADPSYPELSRYAGGEALKVLTTGLTHMRSSGLRARGETVYHPQVESLRPADSPARARVRDCMDTSGAKAYRADGGPYEDTPGGPRLVIADLERTGDAWKVTGLGVHEVGSCVL